MIPEKNQNINDILRGKKGYFFSRFFCFKKRSKKMSGCRYYSIFKKRIHNINTFCYLDYEDRRKKSKKISLLNGFEFFLDDEEGKQWIEENKDVWNSLFYNLIKSFE